MERLFLFARLAVYAGPMGAALYVLLKVVVGLPATLSAAMAALSLGGILYMMVFRSLQLIRLWNLTASICSIFMVVGIVGFLLLAFTGLPVAFGVPLLIFAVVQSLRVVDVYRQTGMVIAPDFGETTMPGVSVEGIPMAGPNIDINGDFAIDIDPSP